MTHHYGLLGFFAAVTLVAADPVNRGEFEQATYGCQCYGHEKISRVKHGHCGYHENWVSGKSPKPWCRTKYECGERGWSSWAYCDEMTLERRPGDDGKFYTVKEMSDYYGARGKEVWKSSEKASERRMADNNKAYDIHEFRFYYVDWYGEGGWMQKWREATPEKRKANDGYWYTWTEFHKRYGADAWNKWNYAGNTNTEL